MARTRTRSLGLAAAVGLILSLAALPAPSFAALKPAQSFHDDCTSSKAGPKIACAAYIQASLDALAAQMSFAKLQQRDINVAVWCVPDGVSLDQIRQSVLSYGDANPDRMKSQSAQIFFILAMIDRYPCNGTPPEAQ